MNAGFLNANALLIGGAVAAAAAAVGLYVSGTFSSVDDQLPDGTVTAPEPVVAAPVESAVEKPAEDTAALAPKDEDQPDTAAAPSASETPEDDGPSFDVVRVEADGTAVIAGRAEPSATVAIMLDRVEVTKARADAEGRFVSFLTLPRSDRARVLTLAANGQPGQAEVILAPTPQSQPGTGPQIAAPSEADAPAISDTPSDEPQVAALTPAPGEATEMAAAPAPAAEAAPTPGETPSAPDNTTESEVAPDAESTTPEPQAPQAAAADPATPAEDTVAAESAPETPTEATPEVAALPAPANESAADPSEAPATPEVSETPAQETPSEATEVAEESDSTAEPTTDTEVATAPADPETSDTTDTAAVAVESTATDDVTTANTSETDDVQLETTPPVAPTVLLSDAAGVRVLQAPSDASPEVMSSVALDTISYSDAGEVELSGRAPEGGSVRVYLDNAPVITSRIQSDGNWRTELPEVDVGIYTLRIDQVDDAGKVTSRIETPFKREAPEQLAAADTATDDAVRSVTVQPGNTLWAIARDTYGEGVLYVRVFEANRGQIRDPDLIYPGQVFALPE